MNVSGILDALVSHAQATGLFETVNGHEPTSAPTNGLTAAVWVDFIGPAQSSGLQSTTGLLVFNLRVYSSARSEPADAIDPAVIDAVDALFTAYSGDFDLDEQVRCVDLLGQAGTPLSARAGYLEFDDGAVFRVMTLTIPILVNDLWEQVP